MSILPIALRRRLRSSGFSEAQTDALDEASEATALSAREGLASESTANDQFTELRGEMAEFRAEIRGEIKALRADMNAMKWWLFGSTAALILAATAAILSAIVVWG